jgi:hypothetical protein
MAEYYFQIIKPFLETLLKKADGFAISIPKIVHIDKILFSCIENLKEIFLSLETTETFVINFVKNNQK